MIFLISTGGMPKSMFLIVSFGCLYFVCRVLFDPELRARMASLFAKFAVAILLGFALSAFILLPFAEFLRVAFDAHQPTNVGGGRAGLGRDGSYALTIQYLLPLIFGPPLGSVFQNLAGWTGIRGYWGIVPFFFAVAAVLFALSREAPRSSPGAISDRILCRDADAHGAQALRKSGDQLDWRAPALGDGGLPESIKEPLIALCVAMLAGIGFSILVERRASSRLFLLAGVVVLAVMLTFAGLYLPLMLSPGLRWAKLFYFLSITFGVALLGRHRRCWSCSCSAFRAHGICGLHAVSWGYCRWSFSRTSFFRAST